MLPPFVSQKLKFWSLISMLCLVFVHGYNLNNRYLQPYTTVQEPLTFTTYVQYFLSNGLFRFRIPLLFCISGYLITIKFSGTTYKKLVSKRFKTIFIPYLLWSTIGLLFTWMLLFFSDGTSIVQESGLVQLGNNINHINQYSWWVIFNRILFFPIGYHLWFLKTLFLFVLAYPCIKWLSIKAVYNKIFFSLVGAMWFLEMNFLPISVEGLLFFGMGINLANNQYNIQSPQRWMKPQTIGGMFILSAMAKTYLAFVVTAKFGVLLMVVLHKVCVFSGLIFAWYYSDKLVKWALNHRIVNVLIPYTFIIYVAHVPLITYSIIWVFKWANHLPYYRLLAYIFLDIAVIFVCVLVGFLLKKMSPKCYNLLTGGRGIAS